MKKIDRAVEIIRLKDCKVCDGYNAGSCVTGWHEEVKE